MPRRRRNNRSSSQSSEETDRRSKSGKKRSSSRRSRSPSASSSSSSSSSSSRKKQNYRNKSRKSRSRSKSPPRSSKSSSKGAKIMDDYESRLPERSSKKNYEFNDGINDLYKSEDARRQEINKLKGDHDSGGGFVPKQFKSSRSNPHSQQIANKSQKERNDLAHENAIFSNELVATVKINVNDSKKLDQNQQQQPPNKVNSSIMHESLFEDPLVREKRWKLKMAEYIDKLNKIAN